jgi:hypothetical protein
LKKYREQSAIYTYAVKTIQSKQQLKLLICGGPGTGKTFLTNCILKQMPRLRIRAAGCSFQGVAASLMRVSDKRGQTYHSMFQIARDNNGGTNKIQLDPNRLQKHFPLLEKVSLVVMDEISMTGAEHFSQINSNMIQALRLYRERFGKDRLQHLDVDKPFLGMHFIASGDFDQIDPVGGTSLATAMIQRCISQKLGGTKTKRKIQVLDAANLFSQFTAKFLTQQIRASGDRHHNHVINSMRTTRKPLTKEIIDGIQDLTSELVTRRPKFEFAPILCSTNVSPPSNAPLIHTMCH